MSKSFFILICIALCTSSCHKSNSCYDVALAKSFANKDCNMQYVPVVGCDGITYSNECVANQNGIRVR